MSRSVLADTSWLVALLDPRDRLNARALTLAETLASERASLLTSDAIILEFANYFARGPLRGHAGEWMRALRSDPGWEIAPVEGRLLARAEVRYRRHVDKSWSLTDCHSMELMLERRVRDVATADAGFVQAGFRCLLR
ncbi:MAG TPA: PIN domain-containing protein [Anaeromyxobacteraceae bacterium]|nr:PIN domain-containing protein [Anaeromyxobacteraceae bacterium]